MSSFFDAIAAGCSTGAFAFSGGYNSTSEELAMNVAVDVQSSRTVREAIQGLASIFGNDLALDDSFYNDLLDQVSIDGSLLLDVTVGAGGISSDLLNTTGYGNFTTFFTVNRFEVSASLGGDNISLDFPVSFPQPGAAPNELLTFGLQDASILVEFSVSLDNPTALSELFSSNSTGALSYGGILDVQLPVEIDIAGQTFGFALFLNDDDLFLNPTPQLSYEIDVCSIRNATEELLDGLSANVKDTLETSLQLGLPFDVSQVTDPIIESAESALDNFTTEILDNLGLDCDNSVRRLQESLGGNSTNTSLASRLQDAIQSIKDTLDGTGIDISGTAIPAFDSDSFVASVNVTLNVEIATTASEILQVVNNFLSGASNTSAVGSLGVANSSSTGVFDLDLDKLLNDTAISAGFDISFGLE